MSGYLVLHGGHNVALRPPVHELGSSVSDTCLETLSQVFLRRKTELRLSEDVISSMALSSGSCITSSRKLITRIFSPHVLRSKS
ncbi:hypothetical protein EYF80_019600 [Liparis tanakae]|uniref:Uncharacterized protein n=1 Tax=Liparis tanakae TaxID=230148 RepID=A0A4Z2HX36_9TELE|nr:hypothetical protein EYF80_019600 [Liparis tanakae]